MQYVTCHFSDINHVTLTINKSVPNCAILNMYDSYPYCGYQNQYNPKWHPLCRFYFFTSEEERPEE